MSQNTKGLNASAEAFSPRRASARAYRRRPLSPMFYGRYYSEMMDLERERIRAKIAQLHHEEEIRRYQQMHRDNKRTQRAEKKKTKKIASNNYQLRGFKSKQNKINVVFDDLVEKFRATGLLREEVHRSYETTRVHAKTFAGLMILNEALNRVTNDDKIEIKEIGFHKSMKNKYQQKGILVYIKVGSQDEVERLFDIYNSYGHNLKDHAIAVTKEERAKLQSMKDELKESSEADAKDNAQVAENAAEVETAAVRI
jgi:hypothetical protein